MTLSRWQDHPFRLLLILEWMLLGIAVLTVVFPLIYSPLRVDSPRLSQISSVPQQHAAPPPRGFPPPGEAPNFDRPPPQPNLDSPLNRPPGEPRLDRSPSGSVVNPGNPPFPYAWRWSALASIAALGLMGWRLPNQRTVWPSVAYTGLGFGLGWLAVLLNGRGESLFPPLLLIVVIRACLLFPWRGRLIVGGVAYVSFVGMMLMGVLGIQPLGIPLGRQISPRILFSTDSEGVQAVVIGLIANAAILFALVLAFVLLLVGALLSEKQRRSELIQAHSRLRHYALLIEDQATLQERNRIAREIHDALGHSLTAQSIQLENAAMLLADNPDRAASYLDEARQLGKAALKEVRASVSTLRKNPLQGVSLTQAIEQLVRTFERDRSLQVRTHLTVTETPATDITTALYRITQEALTNIARHSQATQVHITLTTAANHLRLLIHDNGIGFTPSNNATGFGLQSMRERAEALGGTCQLASQPGQGCQLQIDVPLRPSPQGRSKRVFEKPDLLPKR